MKKYKEREEMGKKSTIVIFIEPDNIYGWEEISYKMSVELKLPP